MTPFFLDADDIRVADPASAVRDARALIVDRNAHPEKYGEWTLPDRLPASLRLEGLRYAKVHADHVDLVLARNPDWSHGARIWGERHRPHRDQPTRYRDIYYFRFAHESARSVGNIP